VIKLENKKNISLKELEKKAYKSIFEDGLWDIFFGMIFLGFSLTFIELNSEFEIVLKYFLIIAPWNLGAILILMLGKRYITIPRLGYVEFGPKRQKAKHKLGYFIIINIMVFALLLALPLSGILGDLSLRNSLTALLIGFLIIWLPLSVVAFILSFSRLYIYAIMGGISFYLTEILYPLVGEPFDAIISFGIIGGIMIIIGIALLVRFLQKYPSAKINNKV
jgi:hypothetical protein